MPKKKHHETQAEQSARFKRDAQKLIDAGELNPTEADAALERLVASQKKDDSAKRE
jgi:hypothetical protein